MRSIRAFAALLTLVVLSSRHDILAAQEPIAPAQAIDDTIEAGEADAKEPARSLVEWNHYEGPFFTIRAGGGVLFDYAAYRQDDSSKQQFDLNPEFKVRDVRVLLKGRLKFKRQVTWSSGLMYDGP